MSLTSQIWHYRALGAFWILCGIFCLIDLRREYWWSGGQFVWLILVGLLFVLAGLGCCFGTRWGRCLLWIGVAVAGLIFADMLLLALCRSNARLALWMLAGSAVNGYTVLFRFFGGHSG